MLSYQREGRGREEVEREKREEREGGGDGLKE